MRLTLLHMILNDVDMRKVALLKKRKKKSKAVTNYLKIVESFSVNLIDKAKALLRSGVFEMMNDSWVFHKAFNTQFRDRQMDARIAFEQYMSDFRKQLKDGKILNKINKEKEMEISSAIEREEC